MFRRVEDRIRNLCKDLVATSDPAQQLSLVTELRGELHRHMERLRLRLGEYPIEERRSTRSSAPPFEIPALESAATDCSVIQIVVIQEDRHRSKLNSPNDTQPKKPDEPS